MLLVSKFRIILRHLSKQINVTLTLKNYTYAMFKYKKYQRNTYCEFCLNKKYVTFIYQRNGIYTSNHL